ncbi:hypothetical protein [Embleya sp. NBC_00896]|uniref:hypothetical protein n=1 Tax=Embleya sp. NBC_00896 TaxID=2975961 RepID=UPI003868B9E1|nr:hypothetical protein OG928_13745 [Embleya sp. NBC_00896]
MTVPAVPRGLRSLIPGPGEAEPVEAGPAEPVEVAVPPVAARTRSVLDGLAPVTVPRAVAESTADVLCALAATAPRDLAQVAHELAARLRAAARTD